MLAPVYLVIFLYAGPISSGDSVAVASIPVQSVEVCHREGNSKLKTLTSGNSKVVRYTCIDNTK